MNRTVFKSLHALKALSSILVTEEGMFMEVRELQEENIDNIEYQLFMVNTIEKWMCFLLAYRRKLRFNVFILILQKNVSFGPQNEGNDTIRRIIVRKTVRNKKRP